jgi:ABC-2 type transport system ATP-binding protein
MSGPVAGRDTRPAGRSWGTTGIRVTFDRKAALDDITMAAVPGMITAVAGGDGAGKTTLLRCLAGALAPVAGLVTSPGAPAIGYFPASSGTYPDLTVAQNLAFRAAAYGLRSGPAAQRAAELTELAGLADARDRLAGQLSGGMRQKLGVIAAMLHRPDLLILDEPSTGVDPVSRSGLWWLITRAAADGAAVVLSTTYLDDAQRAGTVLVLDAGRRLASGTPEQIVADMPGAVLAAVARPDGPAGRLAWRRGGGWRIWVPPGGGGAGGGQVTAGRPEGEPVTADLQDAITVAALARELAGPVTAGPATGGPATGGPITGGPATAGPATGGPVTAGPATGGPAAGGPAAGGAITAGPATGGPGPAVMARPVRVPAGPLAECVAVTCRFGSFTAVSDVTIQIQAGEVVGLLGANGAGKTTLIRALLGLQQVSAGTVTLLGEPPSRQTRRRIGYVPQGLGLYEDLTAAENMAFAAAAFGSPPAALPEDIARLHGVPVGMLPLGLQRRTAFAQALAHRPDVLILDEPTSGVDPLGRARLWETIARTASGGAGVLVSTHYMEEAGECDRLVVMAGGEIVAAGTASKIIGTAQVTVVEAADWAAAFDRLAAAGWPAALAGRTLRVPGASVREVAGVLTGVPARLYAAPATLEERFFELARHDGRAVVPA